ncbi:hypothetical protein IWX49DRAFT_57428 [Phyllosticta citricarpa]|uniref:Uncharacterized protein n=2 Tax=Phyllosticta TaxID=121621 RepID=A0ABR1LBI5_9PEZI
MPCCLDPALSECRRLLGRGELYLFEECTALACLFSSNALNAVVFGPLLSLQAVIVPLFVTNFIMGKRLLLCLVALSGNAFAVAVPPVLDASIPSLAATPVIAGAKSAISSAVATSQVSVPLAPASTSAMDNSTASAIFVAGIPKSALMPLAQLLSSIVNTLIGLITKNYADVVSVTNATAPLATSAPAIVPRDAQLDVVGVLNGVGKGLGGVLSGVANVVAVTQTNGLGQVVGTVLAAVPSGVNNVADAIPILVPGVTNTVNDVTNSKLTSTLLSNPIAAIQLAISSLIATLFGGGDRGQLLGPLQTTLNNLLTKRDGARDFKLEKRQQYAPPPDTRGPYSHQEEASPAQPQSSSFSPVSTGAGSAEAATPGVIAPPDSLTPLLDVPTSLAALDYLGSVAVASVPESVLSYASTADPIAELLSTVAPLATPSLLRRDDDDKSPFASAIDKNLAVASVLSNPNLNAFANPLLNPAANGLFNPAANPALNPLADPSVANSIAASVASEVVDVAQTVAESAAAAATSIAASVNPDIVSDGDLSYPMWLLDGVDPSDPAYIDSLDWDDDDYDAEGGGNGFAVWNNDNYDPSDNVYTNWYLPYLQISTPVEEFPSTSDVAVSLLPTSVVPFSFSPTTEYYLPPTPVTNYLPTLNPTIASQISAIVPTISQGQVLDRRQLEALSSFVSRIQQGLPSSVKAAPSALNSMALDKVTNPLELLAKLIGAQASPVLNVLASQIQAAPTAGAALVAAQISAIQPIMSAIPSAISSDLAQATSAAGPALAQVSGALEALKSINIPSAIGEVVSVVSGIIGDGTHVVASDVPNVVNAAVSNLSRILPTATVAASFGNPSNPVAVTVAAGVPGVATFRAGAGVSAFPHVSVVSSAGEESSSADDEAGLKDDEGGDVETRDVSSGTNDVMSLLSSLIPSAASSSPVVQLLLQLQIAPILFFLPMLLSNPLAVGGSSLNPLLSSLSSSSSSSSSNDVADNASATSSSSSNPLSALFSFNPLSTVLESTDMLLSLLADSSSDVLSELAQSLTSKWSELFQLALQAQVEAAKLGAEVADVLLSPD